MSRSVSDIHPLFSDHQESSRNVESETMSMLCLNRYAVSGVRGVWKTGAVFCQGVCGSQRSGSTTAPHPRREIRISQ